MWAAYSLGVHGRGPSVRAVKRMLQHAAREIRNGGAQAGTAGTDSWYILVLLR